MDNERIFRSEKLAFAVSLPPDLEYTLFIYCLKLSIPLRIEDDCMFSYPISFKAGLKGLTALWLNMLLSLINTVYTISHFLLRVLK